LFSVLLFISILLGQWFGAVDSADWLLNQFFNARKTSSYHLLRLVWVDLDYWP